MCEHLADTLSAQGAIASTRITSLRTARTCDGAGSDVDVEGDAAGGAPVDAVLQCELDLPAQMSASAACSHKPTAAVARLSSAAYTLLKPRYMPLRSWLPAGRAGMFECLHMAIGVSAC